MRVKVRLVTPEVAKILCFPQDSCPELESRVEELLSLGVEELVLEGPVLLPGNVRVYGKGTVGLVLKCVWRGVEAALKVRRLDANRESLEHEAKMLKLANAVGVGPKLYAYSRNFIVREFVNGVSITEYVPRAPLSDVAEVLKKLLIQARALDKAGLYHAQLTRPHGHVLVDVVRKEPYIIDFETASTRSKKSNVTAVVQYFYIRDNECSRKVRRLAKDTKDEILRALATYKRERSDEAFTKLLRILGLE